VEGLDGRPIEDAIVSFSRDSLRTDDHLEYTDRDGEYVYSQITGENWLERYLEPGTYSGTVWLTVHKRGYYTKKKQQPIRAGATVEVKFELFPEIVEYGDEERGQVGR
jgi:hypothetical protein